MNGVNGEQVPEGWIVVALNPPGLAVRQEAQSSPWPTMTKEGGVWVLKVEKTSATHVGELFDSVPVFSAPTMAACAAWWTIEQSNEPLVHGNEAHRQAEKAVRLGLMYGAGREKLKKLAGVAKP